MAARSNPRRQTETSGGIAGQFTFIPVIAVAERCRRKRKGAGIDVIRSVVPAAQVVSELMADFLRYADFLKAKASAEEATPKA